MIAAARDRYADRSRCFPVWPGRTNLQNREQEVAAIDRLLDGARVGEGSALVLRGEPGAGLTSLLRHAAARSEHMRVITVTCDETEQDLGFAAVHQLCSPMLGNLPQLPAPQQEALGVAFGRISGRTPEPGMIALGVLGLLSAEAGRQPVLCLVDDAQWLDPGSALVLAFVARRLLGESLAMLFALQLAPLRRTPLGGVAELVVANLPDAAARALLVSLVEGHVDAAVADSIIVQTLGNPLAVVEAMARLTADQLAGVAPLPEPFPVGDRLTQRFVRQVGRLPDRTRTLLLLLAADPAIDTPGLWGAAAGLGLSIADAEPAELDGLVALGDGIRFRQPMVRAMIYSTASEDERQRVHAAIADSVDARLDPGRHAWHRAATALGFDEEIAEELSRTGTLAAHRGDNAASAAMLERSWRLTGDPVRRFHRGVEAVRASLSAGIPGRASAILAQIRAQRLEPCQEAHVLRLRGAISFALGYGADAATILTEAAEALEPYDFRAARDADLEAIEASIFTGRFGRPGGSPAVALTAPAVPVPPAGAAPSDVLLEGLTVLLVDGHERAVPIVRRAVDALLREGDSRWLPLASVAAMEIWDDDAVHAVAAHQRRLAREIGSIPGLATAVRRPGGMDDVLAGRFDAATLRFQEPNDLMAAVGDPLAIHANGGAVMAAAWRGEADTRRALDAARQNALARGFGRYATLALYATAIFEIGRGRYEEALNAALEVVDDAALGLSTFALPEVVTAAARLGEADMTARALTDLERRATPGGTHWGLGVLQRARALASPDDRAEPLYSDAIRHLRRSRTVPELGRAHLVYGEWLRRMRRRREAREQLLLADEIFTRIGAAGFGERTRTELLATGHGVPARAAEDPLAELTSQERRIAELVSEGNSNTDIAARLFISPRTVEYHLHKIFRKLEVASRTQLAALVHELVDDE
jgi:DNA-binding CsgD family transcriptional regulator